MREYLSVAILGMSLLGTGQALASSEVVFHLTAHVDPYCKISLAGEEPINIVNGAAQIGRVQEICNVGGGYNVTTSFTNVSGGQLNVDGENYAIDASGNSLRQSPVPAIRNMNWQIADASLVSPLEPVVMRVTITPH